MTDAPGELKRAAFGLDGAMQRWREVRTGRDPDLIHVRTAEVLWWAISLDEVLPTHRPSYTSDREANCEISPLWRGLRYARNQMGHRITAALELTSGYQYPYSYDMAYHEWVWRPVAYLQAREDGKNKDPRGPASYAAELEGKASRFAIEAFSRWLLGQAVPAGDQR